MRPLYITACRLCETFAERECDRCGARIPAREERAARGYEGLSQYYAVLGVDMPLSLTRYGDGEDYTDGSWKRAEPKAYVWCALCGVLDGFPDDSGPPIPVT